MKININNKIYIQKKDIELIIKTINKKTPKSIIEIYKENINLNELDFIQYYNKEDIDFFNSFWFIIDYNDFKDFTGYDFVEYRRKDWKQLRAMQYEYDKHYMIAPKKTYNNFIEMLIDIDGFHIPNETQAKKYPLEIQLLHNKLLDFSIIDRFNDGHIKLNLPDEVFKQIRYSKKQLQKIYYEVLSNNLSFEELKPIEKQLYSIFTRINYSPEILTIIRKIININKYNTIEFIQDDLLDLLLYLSGKKTKFEESTSNLINYLYTIGYNNFENFDSKIILEMDLRRIKKTIKFIITNKPDNYFINGLAKYNYVLSRIIDTLNKISLPYKTNNDTLIEDIILNMIVFVYFKPEIINDDFDFIQEVYEYLKNNMEYVIKFVDYGDKTINDFEDNFIKYFNNANKLLIDLYNKKSNKTDKQKFKKLNNPRNF